MALTYDVEWRLEGDTGNVTSVTGLTQAQLEILNIDPVNNTYEIRVRADESGVKSYWTNWVKSSTVLTKVVGIGHFLQETGASTWTNDFVNPVGGNLILVFVSCKDKTITGATYGGVALELVAKADADWPGAYVYGLRSNFPAEGQSHQLVVSSSIAVTGAVHIMKLKDVQQSALDAPLSNLPISTLDTSDNATSNTSTLTGIPEPSVVFNFITVRDAGACTLAVGEGLTQLYAACFEAPRSTGLGYQVVEAAGDSDPMTWTWGVSNRRRAVRLAVPIDFSTVALTEGTGILTGSGTLLGVGESPVVIPLPTNVRWTNVAGTSMNLEWDDAI